jgi:predicted DNA-binding transcriptional regulator AlpA
MNEHSNIAGLQAQAEASFIGIRKVVAISGFSKATIVRYMDKGKFPKPVIAEGITVRWDLAEVMRWRAEQFKKREARSAQPPQPVGA